MENNKKITLSQENLDMLAAILDNSGGREQLNFSSKGDFLDYIQSAERLPCKDLSKELEKIYAEQNPESAPIKLYEQKIRNISETVAYCKAKISAEQTPSTRLFVERVYRILNGIPLEDIPEEEEATAEPTPDTAAAPEPEPKPVAEESYTLPSIDKMQNLYDISKDGQKLPKVVDDSSSMKIYPNSGIRFEDNIYIIPKQPCAFEFSDKIGLIVNSSGKVTAVVSFVSDSMGRLHIVSSSTLDKKSDWGGNNKFNVVMFRKTDESAVIGGTDSPVCMSDSNGLTITLGEPQMARSPLCIDFGTCNTTAGSFGIIDPHGTEPELVEFIDVTKGPDIKSYTLPTVVYVSDCSDRDNIRYLFGYQAQKRIQEKDFQSDASVFYEIKRWITTCGETETIYDENGDVQENVKRQDIIFAYIRHVISEAERFFRVKFSKLHFTAPVRMKERFISLIEKEFGGEFEIVPADKALDEGVAVIYDYLHKTSDKYLSNIRHEIPEDEFKDLFTGKKSIVIDCGGGTTDVASCEWTIDYDENGEYIKLDVQTCYENGDSNFGGNNITYRILQFLKIKLACEIADNHGLNKDGLTVDIINRDLSENDDILERIDKGENIYEEFLNSYKKAERIIPTRFACDDPDITEKERKKIKRNFFYLWQLAEKIKIEFYKRSTSVNYVGFREIDDKDKDLCGENILSSNDSFCLYYRAAENTPLVPESNLPYTRITEKNVENLIFGDIYELLSHIMPDSSFDMHILSGQSCRIRLFRTLLKEFVPGKSLRKDIGRRSNIKNGDSNEDVNYSAKLKRNCINGAINYMRDVDGGYIRPKLTQKPASLLYSAKRNGKTVLGPKTLSGDDSVFTISDDTKRIDLTIYDEHFLRHDANDHQEGNIVSKISVPFMYKEDTILTLHELNEMLGQITDNREYREKLEKGVKNKRAGEKFFFLVPDKYSTSFRCVVIQKKADSYGDEYVILCNENKQFNSMESHMTFFEGDR